MSSILNPFLKSQLFGIGNYFYLVFVNIKNLVCVFHVSSFLWSDTDSDTVIWRKKFSLNWDFTKSQAWNNIMLGKEAQLDLMGRYRQWQNKYVGKLYISSNIMWKSTWLIILKNLNSQQDFTQTLAKYRLRDRKGTWNSKRRLGRGF